MRHKWQRVSKMGGRYEATPAAFKRYDLYPARCERCGALVSSLHRSSKANNGRGRSVEVDGFSVDGGATWSEDRPACRREP